MIATGKDLVIRFDNLIKLRYLHNFLFSIVGKNQSCYEMADYK